MSFFGTVEITPDVPARYGEIITEHLSSHGPDLFRLAVSAGGSGTACQKALVAHGEINFSQIELYYVDERCVPADSPDLNANSIREAFGDHYAEFAKVYEMQCGAGADAYDALIATAGPLDAIQLGLGPDGHTASLFPESAGLDEQSRLVIMNTDPANNNPYQRMTLTYPAIASARLCLITVIGAEKADALGQIINGVELPGARVRGENVIWLIDQAAATPAGL